MKLNDAQRNSLIEYVEALFGTVTEKAQESAFPVGNCKVCGELVAPYNKHAKYEGGYTCQPAQPEPADSRQDRADQIKSFLGGDDDEPAQLEPAAQGEISELDDRHNRMASPEYQAKVKADMGRKVVEIGMDRLVGVTAAQEMPEAVKNAIVRMRWIADHNCGPYYQEWGKPVREAAEKLESWWRTHSQSAAAEKARQEGFDDGYLAGRTYELTFAQPVALRMTPELSRVLHAANEYADDLADCNASGYSELLSDIGAVIQQAAQPAAVGMTEELALVLDAADEVHRESTYLGRHEKAFSLGAAISNLRQQAALGKPKVELPKVREFIDFILAYREKYQLQVPFSSLEMTMFKLADAALSELDAAEGRK